MTSNRSKVVNLQEYFFFTGLNMLTIPNRSNRSNSVWNYKQKSQRNKDCKSYDITGFLINCIENLMKTSRRKEAQGIVRDRVWKLQSKIFFQEL